MDRTFQLYPFFFFAPTLFAGLFQLCLYMAGWPNSVSWALTLLLFILLLRKATDYRERILQEVQRIPRNHPHPELIARKKTILVFAVAMLSSWMGYGMAAIGLSVHNPLIRAAVRNEATLFLLAPRSANLPKFSSPPDAISLLLIYPPESPGLLGIGRYLAAFLCGIIAWKIAVWKNIPRRINPAAGQHHRGRQLLSYQEAAALAKSLLKPGEDGVPWGGLQLPLAATITHILVVGASNSGKTITLRLLMRAVFPRIGFRRDRRALVCDGKRELLTYLPRMGLRCPIKIMNPLDQRSAAWDIAKDCTDPSTAWEFAVILVPNKGEKETYFLAATHDLLSGVFIAFHLLCPGEWTLRDALLVLQDPEMLRKLLDLHPETRDRLNYFTKVATFQDILTTIATRIAPYRQVAAAWSHATEKVSLRDWVNGAFILVLSTDETMRQSLDAINQAIFKRAAELLLAQDESPERETWIILDELREAGKLDGLTSLLTKGRSFGARVVVGFQDIEGLRAVYGEKEANEIAGLCSNKAILRLDDAETAQWASKTLGEFEQYEIQTSSTSGNNGNSTTRTRQLVKRDVVLPSQFLGLPTTDRSNGLSGYFLSPPIGGFLSTLTPEYLDAMLTPADPNVPNFIPRPPEQQYLKPWTPDDLRRLKLDGLISKSPPDSSQSPPQNQPPTANPPPPDLTAVRRVERHGQG